MDPLTKGATEGIYAVLISMGLPGIVILASAYMNYLQYKRGIELTDTLLRMGQEATKAQEAAAASINRLTDLLLRSKGAD